MEVCCVCLCLCLCCFFTNDLMQVFYFIYFLYVNVSFVFLMDDTFSIRGGEVYMHVYAWCWHTYVYMFAYHCLTVLAVYLLLLVLIVFITCFIHSVQSWGVACSGVYWLHIVVNCMHIFSDLCLIVLIVVLWMCVCVCFHFIVFSNFIWLCFNIVM